jgi:hypothetical protein
MNNKEITTHAQLLAKIGELKQSKEQQEVGLKLMFGKLMATIDIVSILKGGFSGGANQPLDIAKTGLNMAVNLIIDIVLGKHRSVKGYLSSVLIEKFTSTLINNNLMGIISSISSLLNRKSQYEKSQEFTQD